MHISPERELVTALGNTVLIKDDIRRIVSLSPAVTEILFELGLGERVVGVSAFCARPSGTSRIRKVGSYGSARIDVIEELKPDVIFTISGYPEAFSKRLSKHLPVYVFGLPSSVAGIVDLVNRVGIVTQKYEEASVIERELIDQMASVRKIPRDISGYVEIDLGGPVTFGYRSYITDAMSLIGIRSIYRDSDREWLEPDMKYVLDSDPDTIFYEPKMYSRFTEQKKIELIRERGWENMKAFGNNAINVSPGPLDFIAHHGTTFIREVLPWMRDCVMKQYFS